MTLRARTRQKSTLARQGFGICRCNAGLALIGKPPRKGRSFLCNDQNVHIRMLLSAILGTLPYVLPRLAGFNANEIYISRQKVNLAVETRNPERMDNIRSAKLDIDSPMCWYVDLVGSDDLADPKLRDSAPPTTIDAR